MVIGRGPGARGGLRERKKLAVRRALSSAAIRLAVERGLENILTIEDITAEADVSVRTFGNYFSGKYEAICARGHGPGPAHRRGAASPPGPRAAAGGSRSTRCWPTTRAPGQAPDDRGVAGQPQAGPHRARHPRRVPEGQLRDAGGSGRSDRGENRDGCRAGHVPAGSWPARSPPRRRSRSGAGPPPTRPSRSGRCCDPGARPARDGLLWGCRPVPDRGRVQGPGPTRDLRAERTLVRAPGKWWLLTRSCAPGHATGSARGARTHRTPSRRRAGDNRASRRRSAGPACTRFSGIALGISSRRQTGGFAPYRLTFDPVHGSDGIRRQFGQFLPRDALAANERVLLEATQCLLLQRLGRVSRYRSSSCSSSSNVTGSSGTLRAFQTRAGHATQSGTPLCLRTKAAAYAKHLDQLATRTEAAWEKVAE